MVSTPDVTLNDGTSIPQLGLGVYQARNGDEVKAVQHALAVGYRHIDTAAAYRNEEGVGKGVRESAVPRDQIYITSKVWNDDIRQGRAREAVESSLQRLDIDCLDLMLLHWPAEGRVDAWKALINARDDGKVKSIGVSNFMAGNLHELIDETGVVPALNQIEYHPYLTQAAIVAACNQHGVAVEAWSPLMQGKFKQEPLFSELASVYGKTEAQIILRWNVQHNVIAIPKSVTPERIEENIDIFDFTLSDADIKRIDSLERGYRFGPDPETFDF